MSLKIEIPTGRAGYATVVGCVLRHGEKRSPRGMTTLDVEDVIVEIESPYDALPLGVGRSLRPRIAAVEAIQLIGAFHDPELMTWASPNFAQFAEPSGHFYGAYGVRIGAQSHHVVRKLLSDRDSRQAVITLWNRALDNKTGKRDYPCTVSLMFSIVDDKLRMRTIMRSNDVWLGFPYDIFQFTQLQCTLANILGIEPGRYTHYAASLHLYMRDLAASESVFNCFDDPDRTVCGISTGHVDPALIRSREYGLYTTEVRGRSLLACYSQINDPTKSEEWYVRQLAGFQKRQTIVGTDVDECRIDDVETQSL